MKRSNGYFEAFVNQRAERPGEDARRVMEQVTGSVRRELPNSQVHWAGSQRKRTAIVGSDLDLCVETSTPVTEAQRRAIRTVLERDLGRPATIHSHVIRLAAHQGAAKVDLAFANAAFGSRPLPDTTAFHDRRSRQLVARAFKLWARAGKLPPISGWAIEALVVHLDSKPELLPLELFVRQIDWLIARATSTAVEGVLRPAAYPRWNPAWSSKLPGRLEALSNHARATKRRTPGPEDWRGVEDVGAWLGCE